MELYLAVLLIALLELDSVHAGQFMLSRPIVLGALLGLLFQRLELGFSLGALVEMFSLEALPVGGHVPANATIAAGAALLFALGPSPVPVEAAFPAGMASGWAYRWLDARARERRGAAASPGGAVLMGILSQFASTALFLFLAVVFLRPLLCWGWPWAPDFVSEGLRFALTLAPWLGTAVLAKTLWPG